MESVLIARLQDVIRHIEVLTSECEDLIGAINTVTFNKAKAEILCKKLEALHTRFSTELSNYFKLSNDPSADDISRFSDIQLKSEEILIELTTELNNLKGTARETQLNNSVITSKLPKLSLPEFDGNILLWQQFWDHFSSNIDERNLPEVDKLLYLKSSLNGEAKGIIDGLEITHKNYQIAVTTLKERYGKPNQIIDAHYAALYGIKCASNTAAECRKTLNEIEKHIRVLGALGENTEHNHLRFIITEKFPEDIIYEMKISLKSDSIEDMRKQLKIIISAREEASRIKQERTSTSDGYTVETLHIRDKMKPKPQQLVQRNFRNKERPNDMRRKPYVNNVRTFYTRNNYRNNDNNYRSPSNYQVSNTYNNKRKGEHLNNKDFTSKRMKLKPCVFCQKQHMNEECRTVRTIDQRKKKLGQRCYNCFSLKHQLTECPIKRNCFHCGEIGKHNRAICPKRYSYQEKGPRGMNTNIFSTLTATSTILQTAIVNARNEEGSKQKNCRILMDSGSQRTYVTQQVAKQLQLPIIEEQHLSVFTFGSKHPHEYDSPLVKLSILTKTETTIIIYANVVPTITQQVSYPEEELNQWKDKILLADDGSLGDQVDILIGNDYYFTVINTDRKQISDNLFLVNSQLGWIITGKREFEVIDNLTVNTYFQSSAEVKLHKPDLPIDNINLKNLWELECIGITDSPKITKEEEAVKNFNESVQYSDKRYSVSWPWKENLPNLPSNLGLAKGRLVNLLKRINKETLKLYDETIQTQLEKGVIEVIPSEEKEYSRYKIHYLPHHGVQASGKALRIVYDASAKIKNCYSLNECLRAGPVLLEDLTKLLIRFRSHRIGLTADVEKAFLQIGLQDDSKDVTRFLWIKDITKAANEDNLIHLRFCRVPFGVISSPFLLNATIKHHLLRSNDKSIQQASENIYVDNLVTGTKTKLQAISLHNKLKQEFEKISMNLREWSSNSREFVENVTDVNDETIVKVLGLSWNTKEDTLQLRPKTINLQTTKRGILKTIASVYDPCGYVAPSLLSPKLFIQELWKSKTKWDSQLTTEKIEKWRPMHEKLHNYQMNIQRYYTENFEHGNNQLHCFTDASAKAYAAAVYVINENGKAFIIGKSRLTPIKDQNNLQIPRLELLGVLIGNRLLNYVESALQIKTEQHFLWTDSQIVIDWYNSDKLLTPFVNRRIEEIKRNKNLTMRYVPTELNPADVATRPNKTRLEEEYWLEGPEFLLQHPSSWPKRTNLVKEHLLLASEDPSKSDNGLTAVYQIREISKNTDNISEQKTEIEVIKEIQAQYYPDEVNTKITNLSRNLRLFKDDKGVLRCKGRLENTQWSFDMKYPILLPKDCYFTNNLIKKTHQENYHVGVNHTLSIIRKHFWIPQGKVQVIKVLRQCPRCIKHGGGPFKLPDTPSLPKERVNYSSPFTFTGLDYLGPVLVKTDQGTTKRWICLFTCLAIRAIHLEIVQDLTAEEGLLALRRMISTRGVPKLITSDNATQFKLIAEILTSPYCKQKEIQWRFIPQLAPWFGGFYERLVGLVKHCMIRTLQKHLLKDNQLMTITKEIEAILNTRPLTCVDSEMVHVLAPADFLTMGKTISIDTNIDERPVSGTTTKINLIKSWKRALIILEEFKDIFMNRYLPSLRERYQNSVKEPRVKSALKPEIGQIVQIRGDSKNRESWKVGKIVSLSPGVDGHIRVAKVKVGTTEYTRSISQLYPLEVNEIDDETQAKVVDQPSDKPRFVSHAYTPEIEVIPVEDLVNHNEALRESNLDTVVPIHDDDLSDHETNKTNSHDGDTVNMPHAISHSRPVRAAATKALEKIQEWTRSLFNTL